MVSDDPNLDFRSNAWAEPSDTPWRSVLRLAQSSWRQTVLDLPAGPRVGGDRLVSSMLPVGVYWQPNLMTNEAVAAAEKAIADLMAEKRPGLIQKERLQRNLLSSQPLCFNLFGHLSPFPHLLLPWVTSLAPSAERVVEVRLEWAPKTDTIGGSAFDAFVIYETVTDTRGFIGIEVKYAEDLAQGQTKQANPKGVEATGAAWLSGASAKLDRPRLRQFWFNQILGDLVLESGGFDHGCVVVAACHGDTAARDAVDQVAAQRMDPSSLRFSSLDDIVSSIEGLDDWGSAFTSRYLRVEEFAALRDDIRRPGRS